MLECIGGGSLGMLVAGKLALAGVSVRLVVRSEEQKDALTEGLYVEDAAGTHRCEVPVVTWDRQAETDADWLLLFVKQKHITEAMGLMLQERMGPRTRLLCFQNGIGHLERLAGHVPQDRLHAAVTTEAARRLSPNKVRHTGAGTTRIGAMPGEGGGMEQKKLAERLRMAGFDCCVSNSLNKDVWQKLLVNAVINPLTALLGVPNGKLTENEHALSLMRSLLNEGLETAACAGIDVDSSTWDIVLDVCARTSGNHSSMLQDLSEGRETEIEWISGGLIRIAAEYGRRLPVTEAVYRLVKAKECER